MLGATIEELRSVALSRDDASGYFAAMYARVTNQVEQGIAAGRFVDGFRMAEFARTFADWYLGPLHGSRPTPGCWSAAHDVVDDTGLVIVQHLLLGINAHVNHDLPQVVVELGGSGRPLQDLRPDFEAINDVLAETQPSILRDLGLVAGWTQLAAWWGGRRVFQFSLDRARAQAWHAAVRLHGLPPDERAADVAELDRLVSVLAYLIATPKTPMSWVVSVLRRIEDDDPRSVSRRLLGDLA